MIIENGAIQIVEKTGGGMLHGIPIPIKEIPGKPIPCNIKTLHDNKRGKTVDNVFTQSSFEVLIDMSIVPLFNADKVILIDNRGQVKGIFPVQEVQHLDEVQTIRITV